MKQSYLIPKMHVFTFLQAASSHVVFAQDSGLAGARLDRHTSLESSADLICPDAGRPGQQDANVCPCLVIVWWAKKEAMNEDQIKYQSSHLLEILIPMCPSLLRTVHAAAPALLECVLTICYVVGPQPVLGVQRWAERDPVPVLWSWQTHGRGRRESNNHTSVKLQPW